MHHLLSIYMALIYLFIMRIQTTSDYHVESDLAEFILSENSIGNILRHVMQKPLVNGREIKSKRSKESSSKKGHSLMTRLR